MFLVCVGTALALARSAPGVPPVMTSASAGANRHPGVTFSAPRAGYATIYIASKPDRATDGRFLSENIESIYSLTDSEIQSGHWVSERQIDPGTYWAMLKASHDFDTCYISGSGGQYDPACADGYSNAVQFVVNKPRISYTASVTAYRSVHIAYLKLTANPLGEKRRYKVCYPTRTQKKHCVSGTLNGYAWSSSTSDTVSVSTRKLSKRTTFTWYVSGKAVAKKRVRVH
jgi:hypothetical protein